MRFEIEDFAAVKLNSANFRSQLHGEEHVPAVDLGFTMDAPNTILSYFDGFLLSSLYYCSAASSGQKVIDGVDQVLPNLRFPKLKLPLKWEEDLTGYTLTIDLGLGGKSNLELSSCAVNGFEIEPKEGGTVQVGFRVQAVRLSEKDIGKLATLVQHDLQIQLTPPDVGGME
jgi:hypothetical protein